MREANRLSYLKELIANGLYCCSRSDCNKEKPLSEFYTSEWSVTGKHGWCKDCCRKHYQEKRDSKNAVIRKELNRIKKINSGKYHAINS